MPQERVRALGSSNNDVEFLQGRIDRVIVPDADADFDSQALELFQVLVFFRGEGPQRDNIQRFPASQDRREDRKIGDEGLAARRWNRKDKILTEQCGADRIRLRRIELLDSLF